MVASAKTSGRVLSNFLDLIILFPAPKPHCLLDLNFDSCSYLIKFHCLPNQTSVFTSPGCRENTEWGFCWTFRSQHQGRIILSKSCIQHLSITDLTPLTGQYTLLHNTTTLKPRFISDLQTSLQTFTHMWARPPHSTLTCHTDIPSVPVIWHIRI